MPAWLIAVLANLPALIAEINSIIAAAEGNPTPAQTEQLQAYQALLDGASQALAYHVGN